MSWVCKECVKAQLASDDPDAAWNSQWCINWMRKHSREHLRIQQEEKDKEILEKMDKEELIKQINKVKKIKK